MPKTLPFRNRIATRVALGTTAALIVAGGLATWAGWMDNLWAAVGLTIVGGVVTHMAVRSIIGDRLQQAETALRLIRKHEFDRFGAADAGSGTEWNLEQGDELDHLLRHIQRTGQILRREFEEISNMESYRREFVGNVSHELKTPIFSIRGFAETLMNGALDDAAVNRSFVEKIVRNADRLSSLASDLSEISKLETGEQAMHPETFDMRRLSKDVIDSVEPMAAERSISITMDMPRDLPPVVADPARIRQVLVNLVDNAIKYTNDGGSIVVRARREDPQVRVDVVDDGIGIAPDDLPRLTERFFRVDKSRSRSAGGTGLGLSIVKHILAAHDQVLLVESRLGHGSTFGFRLDVASTEG
jgi:two-component system phosphate regulon sensor histidine kinase PhoR